LLSGSAVSAERGIWIGGPRVRPRRGSEKKERKPSPHNILKDLSVGPYLSI